MNRTLILLGGAHVHLDDHLDHLAARGWRISAVHDRDARRRAQLCERLGATALEHLSELAADAAGALVCSETAHHEADITAALRAGLPPSLTRSPPAAARTAPCRRR